MIKFQIFKFQELVTPSKQGPGLTEGLVVVDKVLSFCPTEVRLHRRSLARKHLRNSLDDDAISFLGFFGRPDFYEKRMQENLG